jgi:hypothetical protein
MSKLIAKESTEQVAGNGLLHRRALLGRGLTLAGVVGASGVPTGAAAEPLMMRRGASSPVIRFRPIS